MPINSQHPEYKKFIAKWTKCRDCFDGEDAIKDKGTLYLPKLTGQSDPAYAAYKKRSVFYEATGRTVQSVAGAVFKKDPEITVPKRMEPLLEDITYTGIPFIEFAKILIHEIFVTGRYGIHVDMMDDGSRPFFSGYSSESMVNWETDAGDLMMTVLHEIELRRDPKDKYEKIQVDIFRELALEEGKFVIYEHTQDGDKFIRSAPIIPFRLNKDLEEIPFVFVNPFGISTDVINPPILGLVNMNLSHYLTTTDLEHGAHYTGLPTPWASGVKLPPGEKLSIGSEEAWILPEAECRAGFLEFTGQGLGALEKRAEKKELLMARLGALLLEVPREGVESAEALMARKSPEQSIAQNIANSASLALTKALKLMARWMGISEDGIVCKLNTDYLDIRLDAKEITALMLARQANEISRDTFLYNMRRGILLQPGVTIEQEMEKIKKEIAAGDPGEKTFTGVNPSQSQIQNRLTDQ